MQKYRTLCDIFLDNRILGDLKLRKRRKGENMRYKMFLIIIYCFGALVPIILVGSCTMGAFNKTAGLLIIIVGILITAAVLIGFFIYYKKKAEEEAKIEEEKQKQIKQEKDNFDNWLIQNNFTTDNIIGDFLLDTNNKKWCKNSSYRIYEYSDIVKAKIQKHSSRATSTSSTRTRTSNGTRSSQGRKGLFISGYTSSGKNSTSSTGANSSKGRSYDTSTYDVHISTKIIDEPLVVISCGMSSATADKICAAIDIMLEKKKTKRDIKNNEQ